MCRQHQVRNQEFDVAAVFEGEQCSHPRSKGQRCQADVHLAQRSCVLVLKHQPDHGALLAQQLVAIATRCDIETDANQQECQQEQGERTMDDLPGRKDGAGADPPCAGRNAASTRQQGLRPDSRSNTPPFLGPMPCPLWSMCAGRCTKKQRRQGESSAATANAGSVRDLRFQEIAS